MRNNALPLSELPKLFGMVMIKKCF